MSKKPKFPTDGTGGRRNLLMNVAYPICSAAGKLLRMDGDKIDDYFIEKNNRIVESAARKYKPEKVLLVFPHCLQDWECPHRITGDVRNCQACGKCCVPELIEISDRYNVEMEVVAGGTAARRAIYDHKPLFAIAVACERDMISGIRESIPLPLVGILNERPNGPCRNTKVDVKRVEETLAKLLDGEVEAGQSKTSG
jgi:hypothetical protein